MYAFKVSENGFHTVYIYASVVCHSIFDRHKYNHCIRLIVLIDHCIRRRNMSPTCSVGARDGGKWAPQN